MESINLGLGAFIEKDGKDITNVLYDTMKKELNQSGVVIGMFSLFTNKVEVSDAIKSNKYDIIICQEILNNESIGAGSIKEWKKINPHVRVILVISKNKRGGRKLESLYTSTTYYDALYDKDLSGVNLKALIEKSRTREEAYEYYGLENNVSVDVTKNIAEKAERAEEVIAPASSMYEKESLEEVSQKSEDIYNDQDFNEAITQMENLFETEKVQSPEDDLETPPINEESNASVLNEDIFAGEDLFKNTINNRVSEDADTGKRILQDYIAEENAFMGQETKQNTQIIPAARPGRGGLQHVKGIIQAVIDEQLLMVSFTEAVEINDISDYQLTLLIQTGQRGYVHEGRYKAGALSFKAYGNCFVDIETVILEVSDINLVTIEDKILYKECNLIIRNL